MYAPTYTTLHPRGGRIEVASAPSLPWGHYCAILRLLLEGNTSMPPSNVCQDRTMPWWTPPPASHIFLTASSYCTFSSTSRRNCLGSFSAFCPPPSISWLPCSSTSDHPRNVHFSPKERYLRLEAMALVLWMDAIRPRYTRRQGQDPSPLGFFWARLRRPSIRGGNPTYKRSVEKYLCSIGHIFGSMGGDDPRHKRMGQIDFCLGRQITSYQKEYPPPIRVQPLPVHVVHTMDTTLHLGTPR